MQAGGTLSMSAENPEFGYKATRKPLSLATPTATPLMGNQKLDDVERGNTNSKDRLIDSGSHKRPVLAIRTVSPLVQQVNDNTASIPPMTMRHGLEPISKFCNNLRDMRLEDNASPANGHSWKGKAKSYDLFQHETKEATRERNEPMFSSKIKDILEWRTNKIGTGGQIERQENGANHGSAKKTKKVAGGMRDLWKGESPRNKGPKPGQTYEIANQHIIEDNIDRTVTILTWRERGDEGDRSDTDNMSIYYISPDGYAHEGTQGAKVNGKFERRLLVGPRHGSGRENQGASYGEGNFGPPSTLNKSRTNYSGYRHAQY